MKLSIYALHDIKADSFGSMIVLDNDAMAIRSLAGAAAQEASLVNLSPSDFNLYRLGSYDNCTGTIKPCDKPQLVTNAASVVKPKEMELVNDDKN